MGNSRNNTIQVWLLVSVGGGIGTDTIQQGRINASEMIR